jgi:hypothetical protein
MNLREEYLNYYLRVLMKGFADLFIYKVPKVVSDELDFTLDSIPDRGTFKNDYFCFETIDSGHVALSISDIQLVNFLFDIGYTEKEDEEEDEIMDEVGKIYFRGKKEPFVTGFGEPLEALTLFATLEVGDFDNEPFFSFVDIDGEQVTLRIEEIVVLELPESLVSYGEELLEEQLKELKQKGEKERKRAIVVLDFVRKKKDKEDDNAP